MGSMTPSEVLHLADKLLTSHGLSELGWRFFFNKKTTRVAQCSSKNKTIEMSEVILQHMSYEEIQEVLTHQLTYALTPGAKFGRKWANQLDAVGIVPERLFHVPRDIQKTVRQSSAKQLIRCPSCGVTMYLMRERKKPLNLCKCPTCKSRLA